MGKLVLLRHGNSVWNKKNIFTGWVDVSLSKQGVEEAYNAGKKLASFHFDQIYTSCLQRAGVTLQLVMLENQDERVLLFPHKENERYSHGVDEKDAIFVTCNDALNERYYGDLQGRNKEVCKKEFGEELFTKYRRSYDTPPPSGESLKMTIARTLPYFDKEILPQIKEGKTILVVAHGNSLRGIVKEILEINDEEIVGYEIATGDPLVFGYENGEFKKEDV